jgi:hypothetical protein
MIANARLILPLLALLVGSPLQAQDKAARPSSTTAAGSFVGRWYVGEPNVCRGKQAETEGLIIYTAAKAYAFESRCDIKRTTPRGAGVELLLGCSGEGEKYEEKELLEVVNGKLQRTVTVEGKRMTFSYSRCPN